MIPDVLQLSAFPFDGRGGNPAGVVLNGQGLEAATMQEIAAQVGHSETVFVTQQNAQKLRVRYFSPEMEVDFCGHATIAAGVALGEIVGTGSYIFETNTGEVNVLVSKLEGNLTAEIRSRISFVSRLDDEKLSRLLTILRWPKTVLAESHTPMIANAGNWHPILVLNSIEVLQTLNYDFDELKNMCREFKWPTVQLVVQESQSVWQSRNPFAFGGVYEDPATGSAALAFGAYLRETGKVSAGDSVTIKQGFEMGQPSLLKVGIEADYCSVLGTAIHMEG